MAPEKDPPPGGRPSPGAGEDRQRGLTPPAGERPAVTRGRLRHRGVAELVPVLARRFLAQLEPGDALPTVRMMADQMHSSVSSIHAAIGRLEEAGAIEFETRGRLGAFLVARSLGRLWLIAEGGPLVIALPLASSQRYEALATAIKQVLTAADLDVFFIFARGSRQRLQAMHEGRCHLAVMSCFAAGEVRGEGDEIVAELLPLSYNTGHRVFYGAGREPGEVPLRVVVDRSSADQQLLTAIEFAAQEVQLVPAMYSQILRLLETGAADAAVWTVDEMEAPRPVGILERALSRATQERIGDRDTRAALVGAFVDAPALRAVTAVLDPNRVEAIQQEVMSGRLVPEY